MKSKKSYAIYSTDYQYVIIYSHISSTILTIYSLIILSYNRLI